jgi:serine/threonine protein kinase
MERTRPLGRGATASVYEIRSPAGLRSLKLYAGDFSKKEGEIGVKRIEQQIALGEHDCPSLVQVFDGGAFENRLFLLMTRAPGAELEKCLQSVPRDKIRGIVDQIARAVLFLNSRGICHRDIKTANVFISDDFNQATLLDVSVMRGIYDPSGIGTDHDGQLPVVATTRYTPPEYLFRLLEPGPQLWHALDIYQLGGLLHDLIMRQPLFEAEQLHAVENRYTLAWAVATTVPQIEADDVPRDLVFTAQRALDKDWRRRSGLRVEDFLADANVLETHALNMLGLSTYPTIVGESGAVARKLQRIANVAKRIEQGTEQYLRNNGVIATHQTKSGDSDTSKLLRFSWHTGVASSATTAERVDFELTLRLLVRTQGYGFELSARLTIGTDDDQRAAEMDLPEVYDTSGVELSLIKQAESAFKKLALDIIRPTSLQKE